MKKVSVIIPVYNGDKYIKRCIDSILCQTYHNLQVICLNDGSTDNTSSILHSYNDVRLEIIDKKNTGVSDTRNLGISLAKGEYIAFCDADDMYCQNYIETMVDLIQTNDVDAVRCNYKVMNDKENIIEYGKIDDLSNKKYNQVQIKNNIIPKLLDGSLPCFTCLLFFKRSNIINIKFPTDIHMMEDVVFYINFLISIESLYVTNECLYTIVYNLNGATNSIKNYRRNIFNIIDVNKYIKKSLKKMHYDKKEFAQKINQNNLSAIADYIVKLYVYNNDEVFKIITQLINNKDFVDILKGTDLSKLNFQRRILLKNLKNLQKLKIWLSIRKFILKRRNKI